MSFLCIPRWTAEKKFKTLTGSYIYALESSGLVLLKTSMWEFYGVLRFSRFSSKIMTIDTIQAPL